MNEPNDSTPLFPSLPYFFNQIKSRITGKLGQPSVLDMMSPEQVNLLTPEARRTLSRVPAVTTSATAGSMANYTRTNAPRWMGDAGYMTIPSNMPPAAKNVGVLHEGLHAISWNMDLQKEWEKTLSQASPETRAELMRRSNWGQPGAGGAGSSGYSGSNTFYDNHIVNPDEALAYAGMYGFENVPSDLKPFFKKIMTPVQGPPEPNPSLRKYNQIIKPPAIPGGTNFKR